MSDKLEKIGINQYRLGDAVIEFDIGEPSLWQRFKMRFMPKLWERECDDYMQNIAGPLWSTHTIRKESKYNG